MKALPCAMALACAAIGLGCEPEPAHVATSDSTTDRTLTPPASNGKSEFPDEYYYYGSRRSGVLRALEGQQPKPLQVKDWIGEPKKLSDLKGKVVVVDFWATWCGPCVKAIPHNIEMVNKYKDRGLVFIGVHDANSGTERMAAVASQKKINYPLSIDDKAASARAYRVYFWPTYIVIDRKGVIRAAGLDPNSVDKVVTKLLDEES